MLTAAQGGTLLIVDDDAGVLASMARLFRHEGYDLLLAQGGKEGLERLADREVGVILVDQRMLDMSGCVFFSRARELRPDSVRIVLTGYTDLTSLADAVNRGAIFKFLTKPWEDDDLREAVREAFQLYRVSRENTRLANELRQANAALTCWNLELEQRVAEKTQEALLHLQVLRASQEILEKLPFAVLGIDPDGLIVMANRVANGLLSEARPLLGELAAEVLPEDLRAPPEGAERATAVLADGRRVDSWRIPLGDTAAGMALVLQPIAGEGRG